MRTVPRLEPVGTVSDLSTMGDDPTTAVDVEASESTLPLRPGYMYREANWQIGRAAEKAGITAKEFDRGNRWMAWRRRQERAQRVAQMKSLKGKKKAGKNKPRK
jgi:large subunit ribosomal protein L27